MLHKLLTQRLFSQTVQEASGDTRTAGPQLVTRGELRGRSRQPGPAPELLAIASRRCSAFFAEASVLVLVFGILDFVIQRGHIDSAWVAGALLISVSLLAASIATEFSARRWLGAQP